MNDDMSYSTKKVSQDLVDEIKNALHSVDYGSIEIIITNRVVTQITKRNIQKTSFRLADRAEKLDAKATNGKSHEKKAQNFIIKKLSIDN